MTQAEIDSAVKRKRRAESTERREGKKPINVSTIKKSKNIPSNPKLYAKVKAEAKRKFDVYPSAYANGWLVQEYKRRGGKYKTVTKGQPGVAASHVPSTNWKGKYKKRRVGISALVEKGGPGSGSRPGHKFRGNQHTGGIPEGLEDRYVALSEEEVEFLRGRSKNLQQSLFGGEEPVFDERNLGFGYRTKAGFVIDVDDAWKTSYEEFGVQVTETDDGFQFDLSESTREQAKAFVSSIFNVDIVSPDGELHQVRVKDVDVLYDGKRITTQSQLLSTDSEFSNDGRPTNTYSTISRNLNFDKNFVYNAYFRVANGLQGGGLGTTLLAHWEDQQMASGLERARVHAVSNATMNGGYTWLKTGYEPDEPQLVAKGITPAGWSEIVFNRGMRDFLRYGTTMPRIRQALEADMKAAHPNLSDSAAKEWSQDLADKLQPQVEDAVKKVIKKAAKEVIKDVEDAAGILRVGERIGVALATTEKISISLDSLEGSRWHEWEKAATYFYNPGSRGRRSKLEVLTPFEQHGGSPAVLEKAWHDWLKDSADWYGWKDLEPLYFDTPKRSAKTNLVSRDVIDADGDGIIFEGTEFERRVGKPKIEKASRGPNKPKSLNELFRWWAENDPVAWENDTPEVLASIRRLPERTRKTKFAKGGAGSGENPGHPFRGNQHTGGIPGGKNRASYRAGGRAELGDDLGIAREVRGGGKGSDRQSTNPMTAEARANLKKIGQRISIDELAELRGAVMKNYEAMPKATKGLIDRYCRGKAAAARGGRMGGEGGRGNNAARVKRRERLMKRYGDGHTVGCVYCGIRMGYGQVEFEKLDPVMGYSMNLRGAKWPGDNDANLAPACRGCNGGLKDMSPSKKMGTKLKRKLTNANC